MAKLKGRAARKFPPGIDTPHAQQAFLIWEKQNPLFMRVEAMGSSKKHFLAHFGYKRIKKQGLERGVVDPQLSEFEVWAAYLGCTTEVLVTEWLAWRRRSPLRIGYKAFMDLMIDDLERLK